MELFTLDLKSFIFSILFLLGSCQFSSPTHTGINEDNSIKLQEPRKENLPDYSKVETKLTLILLQDNTIYAYEGTNVDAGKRHSLQSVRQVIQAAKRKYSKEEFIVIIKPTSKTGYNNTVDVLDEMTVNKIERYSIEEPTTEERQKLSIGTDQKHTD